MMVPSISYPDQSALGERKFQLSSNVSAISVGIIHLRYSVNKHCRIKNMTKSWLYQLCVHIMDKSLINC